MAARIEAGPLTRKAAKIDGNADGKRSRRSTTHSLAFNSRNSSNDCGETDRSPNTPLTSAGKKLISEAIATIVGAPNPNAAGELPHVCSLEFREADQVNELANVFRILTRGAVHHVQR